MLKKRIIGLIPIFNNLVVQSFEFKKKLPLGNPEIFVENLDRWGADEIVIIDFSATVNKKKPNFDLIKKIGRKFKSTPITYGGGVSNYKDAVKIINLGFERILLDNLYINNLSEMVKISEHIGAQAIILSLPLNFENNEIYHYDYLNNKKSLLDYEMLHEYC